MKQQLISRCRQDGNVLIITISLVAAIATLVGAGSLLNMTLMRNADRTQHYLEAHALASGALEALYAQWREVAVNSPTNTGVNPPKLSAVTAPAVTGVTSGMVQLIKPTLSIDNNGDLVHLPMNAGIEADSIQLSGQSTSPVYKASASVQLSSPVGTVNMDVTQIFRYSGKAPTDFAIIDLTPSRVEDDKIVSGVLEIHPGPQMNVEKIHTNGILYAAHSSLNLEDVATFGDDYENEHHPYDTDHGGTPSSPSWVSDLGPAKSDRFTFFDVEPGDLDDLGKREGVPTDTVTPNPNDDGYQELLDPRDTTLTGTDFTYDDPLDKSREKPSDSTVESQRPHDQAAIKIEVGTDGVLSVAARNGTPLSANNALYQAIAKAINPTIDVATQLAGPTDYLDMDDGSSYSFQEIRDNRTGGDVRLTTLDISILTQAFEGGMTTSGDPIADDPSGTVVIPSLKTYDFGFASGTPADDETRAIIDDGSGTLPNGWNGAIHFEDKSANYATGAHRGLRLRRGGKLPMVRREGTGGDSTMVGMSFITPNPAYIEGDFNTGTTYEATLADLADGDSGVFDGNLLDDSVDEDPASNRNNNSNFDYYDDDNRIVAGYEDDQAVGVGPIIPPASVMADAVNILSNAWQDSASENSVGNRGAIATTMNTAIISGVVPTGVTDAEDSYTKYSGGAENYPRFLEDWSGGKVFVYHGSMIMAFESRQAYVRWGKSNVYSPPKRKWFHEDSFKTYTINGIPVNNPPPLLPERIYSHPRLPVEVVSYTVN